MDKKLFTAEKIADVLEEMFIKDRFIKWDGTNLRDVVMFTGLHKNFGKWFLSWHEYEEYVNEHGGIFKIFGENGYYEVPVGSWIVKAPDGLNYAFGEGVKYVYDGYEELKVLSTTTRRRRFQSKRRRDRLRPSTRKTPMRRRWSRKEVESACEGNSTRTESQS